MGNTPEAIRKTIRIYMFVGLALFVGTIVTYLVATVPAFDVGGHGFDLMDALLGLGIAAVKASLVAAVFMHLSHERKAVYWIFASSLVFVAALFALTALAKNDMIDDPMFYGAGEPQQVPVQDPGPAGT